MLNYCLYNQDINADNIILGYKKEDCVLLNPNEMYSKVPLQNCLTILYASGRETVEPYTKEREIEILKQMEEQIKKSFNFIPLIKRERDYYIKKEFINFTCFSADFLLTLNSLLYGNQVVGFLLLGLGIKLFYDFAKNTKHSYDCEKVEADIRKNLFYLENKDIFDSVDLSKEEEHISDNSFNVIYNQGLNANSIGEIESKDLMKLYNHTMLNQVNKKGK